MITVSLALQQALRDGSAVRHAFVEFDHPLGTVYVWSGTGTLAWNGQSWLGVGALGSVGEMTGSKETQAHDLKLQLSGIDPRMVTLRDGKIRGRAVSVWSRWLDKGTGAWFPDSALLFKGLADTVVTDEKGGGAIMTLTCRSPLWAWSVAPQVAYSNEEQQQLYYGDTGFDRMANIPTQTLAGWELT